MPVPVPEDAMEVNALCEEPVDPPDMEAFFDAAGDFYDHYSGEILMRQLLGSELISHRCKSSECSNRNASLRSHPMRKSSARRCSTKPRESRSGQDLWHESTLMECLLLSTTQARHPRGH